MRVTERGQVTIPKDIREKYGFEPDTEVEFAVRDGAVVIMRREAPRKAVLRGIYGRKSLGASTDELMTLLRS